MGLVTLISKGDFRKTEKLLKKSLGRNYIEVLRRYGEQGVQALAANTPVDTGKTAASWSYKIVENNDGISVVWENSNVVNGWANVAILLQYGHGTRNGGYVMGRDYINPALQPIFDKMAEAAWKEVKEA